ncbi:uncharacterized protein N7506_009540 [Penicillium brevicompactum]|uniref:uncharacterized protein n=1 Tax=Penicillium brevicompactum TaxID=5074 RepID=UPI0025401B8F|nr:uncharacterized protein N7506_009540 [Penicillium brevicompactum]KAJ5326438.1 hypothetical protein N7506_009540 [Penicillium brevicompactum]
MDDLQPFTFAGSSRHTPSEHKTKSAPLDRPSFTFIDHDDDLTSKRIKDVNARKAIRSHVMRDVRRRERLAGLKRTSRQNRGQNASKVVDSNEHSVVLRASSQSSNPTLLSDPDSLLPAIYQRGRPDRWSAGYPLPLHSTPNPPRTWFLDPFFTLPGTTRLASVVAPLLYHWKTVFVPMTFPNTSQNGTKEMELMVRTSFSDPGSFFGLMSMCAAHRAVVASQHSGVFDSETGREALLVDDPDYCTMKAMSFQEMSAKVRDPTRQLSNEAIDTIINLLTGSLIIGEFNEVHTHLTGLKRMVDMRGGITDDSIRSSSMLAAIITTDVKAASGLMTKPVFNLTWDAQPIPLDIQVRIRPPASSPLQRLGSGFFANAFLSPSLLQILRVLRDMVFFSIAQQTNPAVIHASDHDFFRVLNCEAEHQLLSYIYTDKSPDPEASLHPVEGVIRVASICFLNHILIVSPSSSGLGRALTKHLKTAATKCDLSFLWELPKESIQAYVWALFIGAQGSLGHIERPWFVERLARVSMIYGWQSWEQVSLMLADYFFVDFDSLDWRTIWDEAMTGFVMSESEESELSHLLGTGLVDLL